MDKASSRVQNLDYTAAHPASNASNASNATGLGSGMGAEGSGLGSGQGSGEGSAGGTPGEGSGAGSGAGPGPAAWLPSSRLSGLACGEVVIGRALVAGIDEEQPKELAARLGFEHESEARECGALGEG